MSNNYNRIFDEVEVYARKRATTSAAVLLYAQNKIMQVYDNYQVLNNWYTAGTIIAKTLDLLAFHIVYIPYCNFKPQSRPL